MKCVVRTCGSGGNRGEIFRVFVHSEGLHEFLELFLRLGNVRKQASARQRLQRRVCKTIMWTHFNVGFQGQAMCLSSSNALSLV